MRYKVEISQVVPPPEDGKYHDRYEQIFEQAVDDLDVPAVIAVVNNLTKKRRRNIINKKPKVVSNEEFERLKGKQHANQPERKH